MYCRIYIAPKSKPCYIHRSNTATHYCDVYSDVYTCITVEKYYLRNEVIIIENGAADKSKWIIPIYILALLFFIFKMMYYSNYVGRFPDEPQHIAYIAYLQETNKIIPEFKDMTQLELVGEDNSKNSALTIRNGYGGTFMLCSKFNYLGHPPLYYQIMRLSGGVTVKGELVTIHLFRLRLFSMGIASLALLLALYIGWSRLGKNPIFHLLYATVCVSVPMLAFDCAGINNDTLSFLAMTIFTLGLLRFSERKRTYGTYMLIGVGVFGTFMSKLTAGAIVSAALGLFVIYLIFKERNIKFILSRQFLASLPFYFAAAAYYVVVKLQTGAFQPSYSKLYPSQYYVSGFYTAPENRTAVMNFSVYLNYFFDHFTQTWVSIQSHVSLNKAVNYYDISTICLVAVLILPVFVFFKRYSRRPENPIVPVVGTMYLSVAATVVIQFLRAYKDFEYGSGYLGGFQSRYYLCCIALFSLGSVWAFKKLYGREKQRVRADMSEQKLYMGLTALQIRHITVNLTCIAFSALLIYEDFIYFVLNFNLYLD